MPSTLDPAVLGFDPTFAATTNLLRTAPPRLPDDAQGGRFVIDYDGVVYIIPKPSLPDEDYLMFKAQQEHLSRTAKGKEWNTLFDSLVEPVRTLEMLRRSWPFPREFLDKQQECAF
jgi:hypothetical protein